LDLAGCSAGEEVRTNLDPTDCSSTVGSKSKRATGQLDTEEGPKTEPRSPLMNSERAPSSAGGDDSGDVTASASTVALFNQLIAILGIDLFAQGNNANQRATRREDVHWVGEQLALFEPIFDGHPYMDGRRCIVSIAHHVKRKLRPDTIIRTVRYLQPALARQYRELSDLREGALSASSAEKYRSWGTEGYVDRDPLGPAAPSSR